MKKLLSICFLSIVLVLMGFTSKAQTTNCCFWLENMQPETLQDISNLGIEPGPAALLPGRGNELVLNNTLSPVVQAGQTDVYKIHFSGCDYGKVSFEWKLYRDGQLVNDNLSAYADISIFTRYNKLNNTNSIPATCGYLAWLGGKVNGDGVCHTTEHYPNRCAGGYPGAYEEQEFAPYSDWGMGYTSLGGQYAFDYFYASFLQNTENIIVINWKQVGTYALVIGVRERTYGTDFDFEDNQGNRMGGHQSCCGSLLAQDSIHYLVTTSSQKAVCDGSTYEYGNPAAIYSEEGQYNVLFGEYTCGHWEVDHIDVLSFYTRINPDIVANNAAICVNELFTADDLAALAPAVETDAPGLVDYKIYWKKEGDAAFTTTVPTPDFRTVGTTTYYVKQVNHYDSVTGDDFECEGAIDTITFKVLPVIAPILTCNVNYQYCNEGIDSNSTVTLTAELNNDVENNCADHIHWFRDTSNTGSPVFYGFDYTLNLIDVYNNNIDTTVVYTAYSFDASTDTYSTTGVSVTLNFWRTPELAANETEDTIVVCPNMEDIELLSNFTSTNFEDEDLDWDYAWAKNEIAINTNTKDITVAAPGCAKTDVYTVTAYVESEHGCISEITRTFTVSGVDTVAPVIAWDTTFNTEVELSDCNFDQVPEAMTLAELKEVTTITDNCINNDITVYNVVTDTLAYTTCEKQLQRTYNVTDACGNTSASISMTYTVINNNVPTIDGDVVTIAPVRPLNNDCKSNLYTYAELLAFFTEHFTVSATCDSTRHEAPLFYLDQDTTVVADSNLDIFANTDLVTVYAQVKDECGHFSAVTPVFNLYKPEAMSIEHAFDHVTELCNTDSAQIYFDSLLIQNGLAPYSYAWDQTPASQCGIEVAEDNVHITVWPLQGGAFNTSAQFIMTATDAYGCVATDTSNAIQFYGTPSVTIVERTDNDDYPHVGEPIVVCPTFGKYFLITVDDANLPDSIDQNLTYTWSGEAIDYTSHTSTSHIAVNHNICDQDYPVSVNVVNKKGCAASAQYSIVAKDTVAPVITLNMPTDTIRDLSNCKIVIPDYTRLFNASTVSDNCWNMENIVVTQTPKADTVVATNTDVVITVAPKCGPAASYTIKVCFPEPRISTEIIATVDNACYPYETVLSTNTVNAVGNFNVKWNDSIVANTITVNPTDTTGLEHSVVVTDANGCEATAEYTLVVFHKPVADDVEISATPNNYCDNEHTNASYTVTAVNPEIVGVRVSGTNEWNTLPYTVNNVPVGTYYFDLKTIHDCISEAIDSIQVVRDTVDTIVSLDLAIVTDNANCVAPWSGTIRVVNPVDGYRYHISQGAENSGNKTITYVAASQSPLTFNFLFNDTYTVDILSTFNCHYTTDPITVADHRETPRVPEIEVTPLTNCDNPNGMITLLNTRSDYDYTMNNVTRRGNGNVLVFGNLNSGNFNLTIASPYTKCDTIVQITVPNSISNPVANYTTTPDEYCIDGNGTLTITPVAGCSYTFNGETKSGDTVQFAGLDAGVYTLYVLDNNSNCSSQFDVTIADSLIYPTFDSLEVSTTPDSICAGTPNGSMSIIEANGYAYTVKFNGEVVNLLNNLSYGEYTVIKRNLVTGCESDTVVTIAHAIPVVNLALAATEDIDCSEIGTAVITPTLTPNVDATFAVTFNGESFNLNGLNAGIYHVVATVTETGCEYESDVTIKENFTYPELTATSTPNYMCTTNKNGTITVVDTQTAKNYTSVIYTLNDVANPTFVGLNNGDYTISATTDNHCVAEPVEVEVVDSAFIVRQFDVVANSMCNPTVSRPGNGSIQVLKPAAATCDYVFSYLGEGSYDINHFNPLDYTLFDLKDGRYNVHIFDSLTGCSSDDIVEVPFQAAPVTVDSISSTPDYLCTGANGSIYVHATCENPSAVLQYSLDGQNFQSSNVFENVEVGTYSVTVKNVTSNCVYPNMASVEVESDSYQVNIQFNNAPNTACNPTMYNGEVHVSATYVNPALGDGNFTYSIAGGSFTGLNEGYYEVTVTDNNTGCVYYSLAQIINDNDYTPVVTITANNRNQNPEDFHFCFGQTDGSLEASAETSLDGDTNFTYEWSSSCNNIIPNGAWTNVYAEQAFCCVYTVKVTSDSTGCTKSEQVKVCVDTLPVIRFFESDELRLISTTPNSTYEVCENKTFTFGIDDPGFQSIIWTNTHPSTDASFEIYADTLSSGMSSFCVKVIDNNGCTSGPLAANIVKLPTATGAETIEGCGTVTFKGVIYTYTDAQHEYTVLDTLQAANSCDSVVTYTIVVKPLPTLTVDAAVASSLAAPHCDGDTVLAAGVGYTTTYVDAANAGWRIISPNDVRAINAGAAFDPTAALTEEMNGYVVFAYAFNGCDTIFSSRYQLNVASAPTMDAQYKTLKDTVLCLGNSLTIWNTYSNRVNWHNDEGTAKLQYSVDGVSWNDFYLSHQFQPTLTDSIQVRFVATNRCGTDVVLDGPVTISAKDIVRINANTASQTICLGGSIAPIAVTVENADSVRFNGATGLVYENGAISGTPVVAGTNSYSLTAFGACGNQTINGNIYVQDTVILNITNKNQTICLGESIETIQINDVHALTTVEHYSLIGLLVGDYHGMSYDFSSTTDKHISGTPDEAGTFTFTVKSLPASNSICQSSGKTDTITVTVKDTVRLQLNGNTNQVLCAGSPMTEVTYTAENATVTFANIADLDTVGNKLSGTHVGLDTVNYSVVAVSNNGCEATNKTLFGKITMKDTVTLALNPLAFQTICLGENIAPVATDYTNATCNVTFPQGSGLAYANDTITGKPLAAGTIVYTVSATSNNGCTSTNKTIVDSVVVNDTLKLAANVDLQTICLGVAIADINVNVQNGSVQSVTGLPAGVTFAYNKISGTPTEFGTFSYTISAQSNCGCGSKSLSGSIVVKDTVKFTVADDSTLTQTVCKGADIDSINFTVANATLTVNPALVAGLTLSNNTISGAPTAAGTYTYTVTATGDCGTKTLTVSLTVNDVPVVAAITDGDTKVCEGDNFVKPTNPTVIENGSTAPTAWLLNGAAFNWTTTATAELNGQTVLFVATNACGADTASVTLTVDTIPVPAVSSDVTTCLDVPVALNATTGYDSYQWFKDDAAIEGATNDTYMFSSSTEGTYRFTVQVTDGNGCVSTETVNGSTDPRTFAVEDAVTVVVSSNPGFIFTHNGQETHYFEANTADLNSKYTWMISNPCDFDRDRLVYVDFDIYYNGHLIPNDSIGEYILVVDEDGNQLTAEDMYVTSDSISWLSATDVPMQYVTRYNFANHAPTSESYYTNHYPNGRMCPGADNFQDLFLHFLVNRPVYKTINKFKKAGEYSIHYTLMATTNHNTFNHVYHNTFESVIDTIGGFNPSSGSPILTQLAYDVITINVTGEDYVAEDLDNDTGAPEAIVSDEPMMKIYPNPAVNGSTINAEISGISGNVVVRIVNLAGNTIAQENVVIPAGTAVYNYSTVLNNLPAGNYFIYVQGVENKARVARKFIITK